MRIMKTFLALYIAVSTVSPMAALAAKKDVLRLAWWGGGIEMQEFKQDVLDPFEAKFPDIDVKLESTPWAEYWTKLDVSIAAGNQPDVIMMWTAEMPKYARNGVLMDLTPMTAADKELNIGDFHKNLVKASTYKKKIMMLPNEAAALGLYYNVDMINQAGVVIPNRPMTRDEWLNAAKKLTKDKNGDGKPEVWGTSIPWSDMQATVHYFRQDGGEMFDEEKDISLLDTPKAIGTVQFFHDLVNKYRVAPIWGDFYTAKVAMTQDGAWSVLNFRKQLKFNWDVAPIPYSQQRVTTTWGTGYAISSKTKLPKEAWELLKFIVSKRATERAGKSGRVIPPRKSTMNAFVDPSLKPKNIECLIDELEYAETTPVLYTWQKVSQAISRVWNGSLFAGKSSVETELKKLTKELNVIMKAE